MNSRNTRLAKLDDPQGNFSALILARSGLVRLGMGERITCDISAPTLYHAVGQGALAVEIRENDSAVSALCLALNHRPTEWRVRAERAMLRVLEGGCSVPVGVTTTLSPFEQGEEPVRAWLRITGTVTSLDGKRHVEHTLEEEVGSAVEAEAVGIAIAAVKTRVNQKLPVKPEARPKPMEKPKPMVKMKMTTTMTKY